jgi:hypothetical protein
MFAPRTGAGERFAVYQFGERRSPPINLRASHAPNEPIVEKPLPISVRGYAAAPSATISQQAGRNGSGLAAAANPAYTRKKGVDRLIRMSTELRGSVMQFAVRRLVVHPEDFKVSRFEQFTAEELKRLLSDNDPA